MKSDLFESFESLVGKENAKPESLKSLIFEFECYINEKVSTANDLKRLSEHRVQDAKEAAAFRDILIKKLEGVKNDTGASEAARMGG